MTSDAVDLNQFVILRTISKAPAGAPRGSPRRPRRRAASWAGGQWVRWARVRLWTFPPCRWLSRHRIAGGEKRLGIVVIYMPSFYKRDLVFSGGN